MEAINLQKVLIVAKCNVNVFFTPALSPLVTVLIVAKCNVNFFSTFYFLSESLSINSSKV